MVSGSGSLCAQTLPSSVDPGRIGEEPKFLPRVSPEGEKEILSAEERGSPEIEGANSLFLTLQGVQVEGGSEELRAILTMVFNPLLNQKISLQEILTQLAAVNQTYLQKGYLFSKAVLPEQEITSGVIQVEIVEGQVHDVRITGEVAAAADGGVLSDAKRRILSLRPFDIKKFERYMLLLNDLPGVKFRSFLVPSVSAKDTPGAFDVVLEGQRMSARPSVSVDNMGSLYAGPWQTSVRHQSPALIGEFDTINAVLQGSLPTDEVKHASAEYSNSLFGLSGVSTHVSFGQGVTKAGSNLGILDVTGFVRDMGVGLKYQWLRSRTENLLIGLGFGAKDSRSKILGTETQNDRLRVARAYATYDVSDRFGGGGVSLFHFEYSRGLNVLGATDRQSANPSRIDGRSSFDKLSFFASRQQSLGTRFGLFFGLKGQYAFQSLLSSEEFGFGGSEMGRGYDPSEATADSGLAGTFELRYFPQEVLNGFSMSPFLFVDAGKLWARGQSDQSVLSLTSAGAGLRLNHEDGWSSSVMVALPLTYSSRNSPRYANGNSPRFLVSVGRKL
jgi:hemolysin activation/secretion protein